MGSTGPFQLRIGALQKTGGEYGEEKNYVFDLKRRLTSEEYDFIWEKINRSVGRAAIAGLHETKVVNAACHAGLLDPASAKKRRYYGLLLTFERLSYDRTYNTHCRR